MPSNKIYKLNRRQFFKSTLGFLPILAFPKMAEATEHGAEVSMEEENAEFWDIVRGLEAQVRQHQGFSKYLHNELRHYYGAVSEEDSRRHADIILGHVVMDNYTMNTISDWHLTYSPPNPQQAIEVMLGIVERYPHFSYLRVACLIKSGVTYEMLDMTAKALACYRAVKDNQEAENDVLGIYHRLAEAHLARLKS